MKYKTHSELAQVLEDYDYIKEHKPNLDDATIVLMCQASAGHAISTSLDNVAETQWKLFHDLNTVFPEIPVADMTDIATAIVEVSNSLDKLNES